MRYLAKIDSVEHQVEFQHLGKNISVSVDNKRFHVFHLNLIRSTCLSLLIDNRPYNLRIDKEDDDYIIIVDGRTIRVGIEKEIIKGSIFGDRARRRERFEGLLKSRMAGMVKNIYIKVGERVEPGKRLLIIEAMKMENEIRASRAGVVKNIFVSEEEIIRPGDRLMEIE